MHAYFKKCVWQQSLHKKHHTNTCKPQGEIKTFVDEILTKFQLAWGLYKFFLFFTGLEQGRLGSNVYERNEGEICY